MSIKKCFTENILFTKNNILQEILYSQVIETICPHQVNAEQAMEV